jgi:uncharacterized protein YggE
MSTRWLSAAIVCAAIGVLAPQRTCGQAAGAGRDFTLTVSGSGEVKARPDAAYVTVGVINQGKRAQEASQANAAATEKVMAALKQQGIAEKDLQTSNYGVQPIYENRPGREPLITGYQVSNQVRAIVRDLSKVGSVIDAALDAGANNIQGVYFGLENHAEAQAGALTEAVRDARRKAETLAKAADVKLAGIRQIQEGGFVRPVPLMAETPMMGRAAATPIAPGELTVSASVTIVFAIAPGGGIGK